MAFATEKGEYLQDSSIAAGKVLARRFARCEKLQNALPSSQKPYKCAYNGK